MSVPVRATVYKPRRHVAQQLVLLPHSSSDQCTVDLREVILQWHELAPPHPKNLAEGLIGCCTLPPVQVRMQEKNWGKLIDMWERTGSKVGSRTNVWELTETLRDIDTKHWQKKAASYHQGPPSSSLLRQSRRQRSQVPHHQVQKQLLPSNLQAPDSCRLTPNRFHTLQTHFQGLNIHV